MRLDKKVLERAAASTRLYQADFAFPRQKKGEVTEKKKSGADGRSKREDTSLLGSNTEFLHQEDVKESRARERGRTRVRSTDQLDGDVALVQALPANKTESDHQKQTSETSKELPQEQRDLPKSQSHNATQVMVIEVTAAFEHSFFPPFKSPWC